MPIVTAATAPPTSDSPTSTSLTTTSQPAKGLRKNSKSWHAPRGAFRPLANQTPYHKRMALLQTHRATKSLEREMKEQKEEERNRRVQAIKDRRRAKEEKERFEKMAEKMHRRVVERRRRREKRNKVLKSGK